MQGYFCDGCDNVLTEGEPITTSDGRELCERCAFEDKHMFNIWTGKIRSIMPHLDEELPTPYFFMIPKRQYPVYAHDGVYVGMIYEGRFLDAQLIYDLFNEKYGVEE